MGRSQISHGYRYYGYLVSLESRTAHGEVSDQASNAGRYKPPVSKKTGSYWTKSVHRTRQESRTEYSDVHIPPRLAVCESVQRALLEGIFLPQISESEKGTRAQIGDG